MKKIILLSFFLICITAHSSLSQEAMGYFLPDEYEYSTGIPTPEAFLGFPLGEFHVTHDQLLRYMEVVAEKSDRVILEDYARSHENRRLVQLIFTAPENFTRLEEMRRAHLDRMVPGAGSAREGMENPLVLRLGYSVHGNESSAGNSALLTAYFLATAQGPWIENLLENTIILLDPCLNPDGFTRHSTWANVHHSNIPSPDPASRQFSEVWPGGRTNHYWFDLNRDYLLLTHPESRGRIEQFHRWQPNVVTDHHEMGANSSFFFQPGVPSRNNPLTPQRNYELTAKIAEYHAKALDGIGSLYFTEEVFDDYYFGKGSSYPDVNGSVGILFEQAGLRGTWRETGYGLKSFAFAIRNQFAVTLSTLRASHELRDQLLAYQEGFHAEALNMGKNDPIKAWVWGDSFDRARNAHFIDILLQHRVKVYELKEDLTSGGNTFKKGSAYLVPMEQEQYRLARALFESITEFMDTSFYDVSTWTMQHSFNMPAVSLNSVKDFQKFRGEPVKEAVFPEGKVNGGKSSYAYLFRWDEYYAPRALYALQKAGLRTRVATGPFRIPGAGPEAGFGYGTILVYVQDQPLDKEEIFDLISETARTTGVDFIPVETGLTPSGIDLGSGSFDPVKQPSVMMVVGDGVTSQEAGEIWHQLDKRYHIPLTLTDISQLSRISLERYNTIILPDGSYRGAGSGFAGNLSGWLERGGTIIAFQGAAQWLAGQKLVRLEYLPGPEGKGAAAYSYADRSKLYSLNSIPGAILHAELDLTHPIAYGYHRKFLPVFKEGSAVASPAESTWSQPVKYASSPLLSGFVSEENRERLAGGPYITIQRAGSGRIIIFHENTHFRGVWFGTNKLFANALFFGDLMNP